MANTLHTIKLLGRELDKALSAGNFTYAANLAASQSILVNDLLTTENEAK